ncbi:MBL fold metallo-hydrolase [Dethiobacter alkaliphilus]|uniref:Beta-lactamase domain protein n=1 Tax=Dethiobacter alkaliphilus AHT 1 TaxID=555088 RepID=C0GIA8_DETAL|nr:MBL fold metallo-hydrolase [Dethiobacter alkaliphilus]EEG76956.1 beta-lactamase domain protein [Dethiobacter alkaliphilus AHT 1]
MLEICMLASGSSGNAIYVATEQTKLLIDAGLSGKKLAAALTEIDVDPFSLDALLLSHDHNDHTCGAGIMARRYRMPLYATGPTWQAAACKMGPVPEEMCRTLPSFGEMQFADLTVESFPIPHDAAGPVGFVFRQAEKSIALVTDLGMITPDIFQMLQNVNCLVLEANHDEEMLKNGTYPWPLKKRILSSRGHLSNHHAADFLTDIISPVTTHVVLAHLSEHNNLPQLAFNTVGEKLTTAGCEPGRAISLEVARRFGPSCHICLT